MALKMTQPFKHPKTGIYQFRKRVPKELVERLGKREEKASLGTRDPREAKVAHAKVLAQVEARWAQLRKGAISLSFTQAVAMSGEIYRDFMIAHSQNPEKTSLVQYMLAVDQISRKKSKVSVGGTNPEASRKLYDKFLNRAMNPPQMDDYLIKHGYVLDSQSRELLRTEVLRTMVQARAHLLKNWREGDFRPDPNADRFPPLEFQQSTEVKKDSDLGKYALCRIFEDYAEEKKISPASYKAWKPMIAKVAMRVPDARDLTSEWVVDWKDELLRSGLANSTVKDGYLAALRSTCAWGKANKRLSLNPVDGVSVATPRKIRTRPSHFTNEEKLVILKATLEPTPIKMSQEMSRARRWIPWLCAYSGARIGEIAQLRKQDIQLHGDIWLMWITPEAGSTKNAQPRFVAIHPHLIEQGFLDFVGDIADKAPLFFNPTRRRGGSDANPQYKKVGERLAAWIRKIGVDDIRVRPNHGWRHSFKTTARKVRMDVGAREYMNGHAPSTEGESYGEFEPDVLLAEIMKLPRIDVQSD
ncbi:integrase [Agrobacterium rhizogenes]|nr:integrase [Rhizobium rhizogenes]NTH55898.1 integrase [Rhizobium rhizogenes]NTH87528.1 integrase [Rhizobium rhizogenes]